jgi:hypothetical protein
MIAAHHLLGDPTGENADHDRAQNSDSIHSGAPFVCDGKTAGPEWCSAIERG